jgi:DNA repair exonuclease SbcCD ATPase subunit
MTNDNNNINELVADDDDPTAELEIPSFARHEVNAEFDAKTFDADDARGEDTANGVSVSELKSDILYRKKTIGRLQYEIEHLHAKWLGLEAEIGARDSQTVQLNEELASTLDVIAKKEELIQKRDRRIKDLKSEIRQREKDYREVKNRYGDLELSVGDTPSEIAKSDNPASDGLVARLRRTEDYADSIRQQSQDLIKSNSRAENQVESLRNRLVEVTSAHSQTRMDLALTANRLEELQSRLDTIQSQHEEEIRILRFELGDANNTVVQTEEMNQQLASDLADAHGFKDELEKMLGEVEEQSSERIKYLEKDVLKTTRLAESYEQKLTTKSQAIAILLAELAKKAEQIESIGDIDEVIHDIDERISERNTKSDPTEQRSSADRISRVLIGAIDDQVLRFPLFKDRLTIGCTKDNDIQLKAAYVSRRHAVIQTDDELTRVIDSGSKDGIQVNSAKVSEHFLNHGDTITIGSARFRYEERKKRDPQ